MFSPTQKSSSDYERAAPQSQTASRTEFEDGGGGGGPLILLVEDNADSRDMLRTLLQLWDFRVIEAHDGEQAIELARRESPSLILMDVKIPIVDGVEATRRIRDFAPPDKMPVVFVSGHAQPGFRLVALAAGGNDYLLKPLDFRELELVLNKYVRKKEATDGAGFQ